MPDTEFQLVVGSIGKWYIGLIGMEIKACKHAQWPEGIDTHRARHNSGTVNRKVWQKGNPLKLKRETQGLDTQA